MLRPRLAILLSLVILTFLSAPETGSSAAAGGTYLPARTANELTFPVARTPWYSVINFRDDWHAPRMRLVEGKWRQVGVHEGNDIFAEPGTPVRAVTGGVVENIGWLFYSGWRIGIRADDGRYWFYAHLRSYSPGLSAGDRIDSGDTIGTVGNTGYGNRPGHDDEFTYHLHIGIQEPSGTWINPYPLMQELYDGATDATR